MLKKIFTSLKTKRPVIIAVMLVAMLGAGASAYLLWPKFTKQSAPQSIASVESNNRANSDVKRANQSTQPSADDKNHQDASKTTDSKTNPKDQTKTAQPSEQKPTTGDKPKAQPTTPNQPQPNAPATPHRPTMPSQPTPHPTPQPVDLANSLRQEIEATYHVRVRYGAAETNGYAPRHTATQALQPNQYIGMLSELKNVLRRYPNGFFREFRANGMPLTFYLVDSVQNNAFAGFFDRQFVNDLKIVLTRKDYFLSLTANHEITHAIDTFLDIKMYPREPYSEYTALNPAGFKYLSEDQNANFSQYVWKNDNRQNAYFTTAYAQSTPREDRAELFKFMMRDYDAVGIFNNSPHLRAKAQVLARQINQNFATAGPNAYWNRLLK
jgi:hypothetical protein